MAPTNIFVVATSKDCKFCDDVYPNMEAYKQMAVSRDLCFFHVELDLFGKNHVVKCSEGTVIDPPSWVTTTHVKCVPSFHLVSSSAWRGNPLGYSDTFNNRDIQLVEAWLDDAISLSNQSFNANALLAAVTEVKAQTPKVLLTRLDSYILSLRAQIASLESKIASLESTRATLDSLYYGDLAPFANLLKEIEASTKN